MNNQYTNNTNSPVESNDTLEQPTIIQENKEQNLDVAIDLPKSDPLEKPKLNRLVKVALINSYLKGQSHVLDIENNSLITGANAAGKTSLMGAISPFFGVPLSSVSRRSEANDGFVEHYLPYENSYIVYEYERNQKPCCVILRKKGVTPYFNFFSGSYNHDLFITKGLDGRASFKEYDEVYETLKNQGRFVSVNLSQIEYEAVISNATISRVKFSDRKASVNNVQKLRSDFSLTSGKKSSFFGFAPIVSNVLQSKMSFSEISDFLIEAMKTQNLIDVDHMKLDSSNINTDDWVRRRAVWHMIDKLKPEFESLEVLLNENIMHQRQLADTLEAGNHLLSQIDKDLITNQDNRAENQNNLDALEKKMREKNSAWYSAKNRYEADIKSNETAKKKLEVEKNSYEQGSAKLGFDSLQKLQEAVDQIVLLQERKKSSKARYEELEKKFRQAAINTEIIERQFADDKNELDKDKRESINLIDASIAKNDIEYAKKINEIQQEHKSALAELNKAYTAKIERLTSALLDLEVGLATLKAQSSGIQYSDEYIKELKSNEDKLEKARSDFDASSKSLNSVKDSISNLKKEIANIGDMKKQNSADIDKEINAIAEKRERIQDNTLFSFLVRAEDDYLNTEKVAQLRKLVKPSLLSRTDLNPIWSDSFTEDFYGLSLDTAVITETDQSQSLQEVRAAINKHEANISELKKSNEVLDRQALKFESSHKIMTADFQQAQVAVSKAEGDIKAGINNKRELEFNAENDKKQRLASIAGEIQLQNKQITEHNRKASEHKAEHLESEKKLDTSSADKQQQFETEKEKRNAELLQKKQIAHSDYAKKLNDLEVIRDNAIKNEGYDATVLTDIKHDITRIDKQIEHAEKAQRRIASYNLFMRQEYVEMPSLLSKGRSLKAELELEQSEHQDSVHKAQREIRTLNKVIDEQSKQIAQLKSDASYLADHAERVKVLLNKSVIQDYETESLAPVENAHFLTQSTLTAMRMSIDNMKETHKQGRDTVNRIKRPFTQNETMFEQLFRDDSNKTVTNDENWFHQAHSFNDYMANEHETMKDTIIKNYEVEALKIENFKFRLDTVNNSLKKFARTINQNFSGICERLGSLAIESLEMDLHSKIEENDWYSTLSDFSNAYNHWQGSERLANPLPSENLIEHLEKVQRYIGQNKLNIKLADQFSIALIIKQHGQAPRKATKDGSVDSLSSNGTIRIAQLIVYLSLVATITNAPCTELKLFIDEIGVIDAKNSAEMLELLAVQQVTAMCAAPEAVNDEIIPLFDNNIACSQDHNNVYSLAQTTDMDSLTKKSEMDANGAFKIPKQMEVRI